MGRVSGEMAVGEVCRVRAWGQGLGEVRESSVVGAVRRVVGVQAQDVRAARLAVRVRTEGLTRSDVDRAVGEREVIRTWVMRGTLHMVAAGDLGWLVGLLGPYFVRRLAGRRRQLGLDEGTCERGVAAIRTVLGEGTPLTRAELVARISEHGVRLDPRSQAPAHLLAYAAMTGVIQRGPEARKDEPTYELMAASTAALTEGEAVVRLARRYLAGYGPAAAEDFAAWSGLPLGVARNGLEEAATSRVTVDGRTAYAADDGQVKVSRDARVQVRLLGHFDTYLLGYRGRKLAVPAEHDRKIQAGGGFINPAVLVDGQVVGTWRQTSKKGRIVVSVEPFTTISGSVWRELRREVADLGRFLETAAEGDFPTSTA